MQKKTVKKKPSKKKKTPFDVSPSIIEAVRNEYDAGIVVVLKKNHGIAVDYHLDLENIDIQYGGNLFMVLAEIQQVLLRKLPIGVVAQCLAKIKSLAKIKK